MAEKKRRVVPQLDWGEPAPAAAPTPRPKPPAKKAERQPSAAPPAHSGRGRPTKHPQGEDFASTTVRLRKDDLWYLDDQVTGIKRGGGDQTITRSELLRGVVAALRAARMDLTEAPNEEAVQKLLLERLST
jgi:hypothetical protein